MAAMIRGAIACEGDASLLLLFQRILPGPPGSTGRVADAPAEGSAK